MNGQLLNRAFEVRGEEIRHQLNGSSDGGGGGEVSNAKQQSARTVAQDVNDDVDSTSFEARAQGLLETLDRARTIVATCARPEVGDDSAVRSWAEKTLVLMLLERDVDGLKRSCQAIEAIFDGGRRSNGFHGPEKTVVEDFGPALLSPVDVQHRSVIESRYDVNDDSEEATENLRTQPTARRIFAPVEPAVSSPESSRFDRVRAQLPPIETSHEKLMPHVHAQLSDREDPAKQKSTASRRYEELDRRDERWNGQGRSDRVETKSHKTHSSSGKSRRSTSSTVHQRSHSPDEASRAAVHGRSGRARSRREPDTRSESRSRQGDSERESSRPASSPPRPPKPVAPPRFPPRGPRSPGTPHLDRPPYSRTVTSKSSFHSRHRSIDRHTDSESDSERDRAFSMPRQKYVETERRPPSHSRSRARSHARSNQGGRSTRSEAAQLALLRASAPPSAEPAPSDEFVHVSPSLKGPRVMDAIASALAEENDSETLCSFARVSRDAHVAAKAKLYRVIAVPSFQRLQRLQETLDSSLVHGTGLASLVNTIELKPLEAPNGDVKALVAACKVLLSTCTAVKTLIEDFTAEEWDVFSLGGDYMIDLTPGRESLSRIESKRCWWEVSAVADLLSSQRSTLTELKLDVAMDRNWAGSALLAAPAMSPPSQLTRLELTSVMHEDTLACILRCTPRLESLRIGFLIIGSTEEDTPRASIVQALSLVSTSLVRLSLRAPSKRGNQDTSGLLDDCVQILPRLEELEFDDGEDATLGMSLATRSLLLGSRGAMPSQAREATLLPATLRVLRAHHMRSFSTGDVLRLLDDPAWIPSLEVLDLSWSPETCRSLDHAPGEPLWRDRHRARIMDVATRKLGIRCKIELETV